jgi:hypothetical protein
LGAIPSLLVGLDHGREITLDLGRLAAAREKPTHAALGGGRGERLIEAVGLVEQARRRRLLGGVDGGLGERDRLGRKRRDSPRQALDEGPELGRGFLL